MVVLCCHGKSSLNGHNSNSNNNNNNPKLFIHAPWLEVINAAGIHASLFCFFLFILFYLLSGYLSIIRMRNKENIPDKFVIRRPFDNNQTKKGSNKKFNIGLS